MRLPAKDASYHRRVVFGRYVTRRTRSAGYAELSESARTVCAALKLAGRAWEDALEPIQDALADRDAADDQLDGIERQTRVELFASCGGRTDVAPYSTIYYRTAAWYNAAPLDLEIERYEEYIQRLEASLPADSPIRQNAVAAVRTGLDTFRQSLSAVSSSRTALSLARTNLDQAIDAFDTLMEKVFGTLAAELGRKRADAFFPRSRREEEDTPAPEQPA